MTANRFTVLFDVGSGFTLDKARDALVESDFQVDKTAEGYRAQWHDDGPVLHLRTTTADAARRDIERRIGPQPALALLAGAIEVTFEDLDEALDEINTLIESQMQLATASGGYLFLHWNDTLQSPE